MSEKTPGLPLYFKIIIGILAGVVFSIFASQLGYSEFVIDWVKPFGDIFIRLLKLIAVPLVLFSIIKGISSISDVSQVGRLAYKTIGLYLGTTIVAIFLGMAITNIIRPGDFQSDESKVKNRLLYEMWVADTEGVDKIDDKDFLNDPQYASVIKEIIEEKEGRILTEDEIKVNQNLNDKIKKAGETKDSGPLEPLKELFPENIFASISNNQLLLQVIMFSIIFGVSLLLIDPVKAQPVFKFIDGGNEVFVKMVEIIMSWAPFFVFALLAGQIADLAGDHPEKVGAILSDIGVYAVCVALGLVLMILFYPLLLMVITRQKGYVGFFKSMRRAMAVAFSTSSSAATLPVTLDCVENNLGVRKNITSFVLPIGATVNMDGTSLYQTVATIFFAQYYGIDLSVEHYAVILFATVMASIGSAAVPGAGLIMLIVVFETLGMNPEWIGLIYALDRILDMLRTVVNVSGDAAVATIVDRSEKKKETLAQPEQ
jgi:Na+/H+-dicarboxylate symporter